MRPASALVSAAALMLLARAACASGLADPVAEEVARILSRPMLRYALVHTREGADLSREILGSRLNAAQVDSTLDSLARTLLAPSSAGTRRGWLTRLVELEVSADAAYAASRAGFLKAPGPDLSFTSWRGLPIRDVSGADLRGADMRGALIGDESILRDAIYDQYTALPFPRAEATARGMRYEPSMPPEGGMGVPILSNPAGRKAGGAADLTAPEAEAVASEAMRSLQARGDEGVRLFALPVRVQWQANRWVRFEAGEVVSGGGDAELQSLIDEFQAAGGEVRRLVGIDPDTRERTLNPLAYFAVERGMPYIALQPGAETRVVHHERAHFRDWLQLMKRLRSMGYSEAQALEAAEQIRSTPDFKVFTERNAVRAEFAAERASAEKAGIPLAERQYRYENRHFATSYVYPECEGLLTAFRKYTPAEIRSTKPLWKSVTAYARKLARVALIARRAAYLHLGFERAAAFTSRELFFEVTAGNRARMAAEGSLEEIEKVFAEILPLELARLPKDRFKMALEAAAARP